MADHIAILDPTWLRGRKHGDAFPDLSVEGGVERAPEGDTLFVVAFDPASPDPLHRHVWLVGMLEGVRREGGLWIGRKANPLAARPVPGLDFLQGRPRAAPGISALTDLEAVRIRLLLLAGSSVAGVADPERLDALSSICSPWTLDALRRRGARWRNDCRAANDDALRWLLHLHDYPAHPSVLDLERHFGGLELTAGDGSPDSADVLFVGPYRTIGVGLLERGTEDQPDLVPVAWGPGDAVYYLDAEGRGFVEDLVEGGPQAIGSRGAHAMVDSVLRWLDQLYGE